MFRSIKEFFIDLFTPDPYSACYDEMENRGIAVMGCCSGLAGGSAATDYLSEGYIGCPHWVP